MIADVGDWERDAAMAHSVSEGATAAFGWADVDTDLAIGLLKAMEVRPARSGRGSATRTGRAGAVQRQSEETVADMVRNGAEFRGAIPYLATPPPVGGQETLKRLEFGEFIGAMRMPVWTSMRRADARRQSRCATVR